MNHKEKFKEKFDNFFSNLKKPNILVCGYTGSGKTSLIQAICGKEVVSDDKIVHGKPGTMDYLYYKSEMINFWDSQGLELGESENEFVEKTKGFIREKQQNPNVDNHVHLVWYCIQGSGARVTPCDIILINDIFKNVIALITKNDITEELQQRGMEKELTDSGVNRKFIIPVSCKEIESQKTLVKLSLEMLPEAYRDAFISAQIVNLESKQKKVNGIIFSAAASAAAAGASPIPISDAAIITPIQFGMIVAIAATYGLPREFIRSSAGPLIAQSIGILLAENLTKLVPVIGSIIGATVAGSLTTALGIIVNKYCVKAYEAKLRGEPMPTFDYNWSDFQKIYNQAKKEYKNKK